MNTADRIYRLVKGLPETQARSVLHFVESLYARLRQFSAIAETSGAGTRVDPKEASTTSEDQTTATGISAFAILQRNGFIGSLQAEPELSSRYKEELDWNEKV